MKGEKRLRAKMLTNTEPRYAMIQPARAYSDLENMERWHVVKAYTRLVLETGDVYHPHVVAIQDYMIYGNIHTGRAVSRARENA